MGFYLNAAVTQVLIASSFEKVRDHRGWSKGRLMPMTLDPQDFTFFPKVRQRLGYQDPGVSLGKCTSTRLMLKDIFGEALLRMWGGDASPYATL